MLFQHKYYQLQVDEKQGILAFSWTDLNGQMQYEDFLEACSNYAGYAFEYQCKLLLIDTHNFAFKMPEAYKSWLDQVHNPRFQKLGVQKQAFITQPEWLAHMKNEPLNDHGFAVSYFSDKGEALKWLAA